MREIHNQMPTEKFYSGYICENGHEQINESNNYCPDCGARIFNRCQHCGDVIKRGYNDGEPVFANPYNPDALSGYEHFQIPFNDFKVPNYCCNCGDPYPWTEKFLREYKEILELQTEDMDKAIQESIYKATEEAIKQKFTGNSTVILGLHLKKLAPQVKEVMVNLLTSVATSKVINLLSQ